MSDVAIRCEGLGKQYRIGKRERYVALRDKLTEAMSAPIRRARAAFSPNGHQPAEHDDAFWALKDVSFEIKHGEVIGVIGRNGAGKSTLLKILSRITEPTTGQVSIHGRVGSLLEVGTGFHPELSGRENIYLNGAILGMRKEEIARKFDEIVAFAEIEKFLDTAVKHYSSGMHMRLAFAVAAHLETDILIVDEVLAVGDSEFQKKCLGKMQDVAGNEGRTVLFVSHNMAAVKSLTQRGIVLNTGQLAFEGSADSAIEFYTSSALSKAADAQTRNWGSGRHTKLLQANLLDKTGMPTEHYTPGDTFRLAVVFQTDGAAGLSLEAFLVDSARARIALSSLYQFHGQMLPGGTGIYSCVLELEPLWLASGRYYFDLTTSIVNSNWDHYVENALCFDVLYSNPLGYPFDYRQSSGYGSLAHLCVSTPIFKAIESESQSALPVETCV